MGIITTHNKLKEILEKGVEKIIEKESLLEKLKSGKKLRIKLGIDPTSPVLHLGNAIPLWKLRQFQDIGHQIVLIIGDFTARIGDPSDKKTMRQSLSKEQVEENMRRYKEQIGKILDFKKTDFCYNSRWLSKISFDKLIDLASNFTAGQMLERENFNERYKAGKLIGIQEFLYPLMQGYDSVAIRADIEIGGTDQTFNLLAGRDIQRVYKQEPQDVITLTLIEGTDGRKMSKSFGNTIAITDSPGEMFNKIMSLRDGLIIKYFQLCTRLPFEEIKRLENNLKLKKNSFREAKIKLAKEIVTIYHGERAAQRIVQKLSES